MKPNARMHTESADGLIRRWNQFWFTPADPTVLGLIRISCGLITLYVHLAYSFDLQQFFGRDAWLNLPLANEYRKEAPWIAPGSDWSESPVPPALPSDAETRDRVENYAKKWGLDPRLAVSQGNAYFSLWFHLTAPWAQSLAHVGILSIMLLFTLGYSTRVTAVLTWLAALSYIQRSQITLFGMDTMMNVLLFYLMISPCGAALSIDRWLARRRLGLEGTSMLLDRPEPLVSANLGLRLIQVHFCFIYMAAGLSKLMGGSWWNGTALWVTLANYEFTPMRFTYYVETLRWLCRHRWLWEIVMMSGTLYTLALEISFAFLVWRPRYRSWMIVGSVLLHTGIAFTMGLIGFGLFMLTMVLAFVPARTVHTHLVFFSSRLQTRLNVAFAPR
ncbi:hypothetical protein BH10PLA2_BH10PLA2_34050 [soil metagenome]